MKVLIKVPETLSEIILFAPVLKVIKDKFKEAEITLITNKYGRDIFHCDPLVNDIWVNENKGIQLKYYLLLRRKWKGLKFTHFLYFGGSRLARTMAWLKRVPIRGGWRKDMWAWIYLNKGQKQDRELTDMHETEYNLNLLKPLGIEYTTAQKEYLETEIQVDKTSVARAMDRFSNDLKKSGIEKNKDLIFIHPGASGLLPGWSSRNFVRYIHRWEQKHPGRFTYVVSYTTKDLKDFGSFNEELKDKRYEQMKKKIYFFDGARHGLRHYLEVLSQAKLFVGHSVGPYYLASALKVNTIGLYLPVKALSIFRWAPFHIDESHSKLMVPEVVCGEVHRCIEQKCPYFECMAKIEVDDILQRSFKLLGEGEGK